MARRRTFLAGGLSAVALPGLTRLVTPGDSAYAMGYVTGTPNRVGNRYALHLAVSTDGLDWTPPNRNNPVATPTAGVRGLFIMRRQTGGFVVPATDLNGTDFTQQNQYIHAWDSAGQRAFTGYRRLRMHSMPTRTWAPEAFWDTARGRYGIVYPANSAGAGATRKHWPGRDLGQPHRHHRNRVHEPVVPPGIADLEPHQVAQLPDRYPRHATLALRVDPVATAADRADATFQVGY